MPHLAALTRTCQLAVHHLAVLEPGKDMFEKEDTLSKPVTGFVILE
jgi:hypothetical protein